MFSNRPQRCDDKRWGPLMHSFCSGLSSYDCSSAEPPELCPLSIPAQVSHRSAIFDVLLLLDLRPRVGAQGSMDDHIASHLHQMFRNIRQIRERRQYNPTLCDKLAYANSYISITLGNLIGNKWTTCPSFSARTGLGACR
jgi:hypothetical protein